jgi:hypothetical protein
MEWQNKLNELKANRAKRLNTSPSAPNLLANTTKPVTPTGKMLITIP